MGSGSETSPELPTTTVTTATRRRGRPSALLLLRAAHIGPVGAVTAVTALLAVKAGLPASRGLSVTAAVFTGQLTIGWGNDLLDAARDREVGRADKPLGTGELTSSSVRRCLVAAALACVVLSLLAGWRSGLLHLGVCVLSAHLYNLGLKATPWSWLPYAVAFGTLPAVVTLAGMPPSWPPLWMVAAAGALGVAAHFLNVLSDFGDDAATGVRGLPHRLGPTPTRVVATVLLVGASLAVVLGPAQPPGVWAWTALAVVGALAVVVLTGPGKTPFHAAVAIALLDVALLTAAAA